MKACVICRASKLTRWPLFFIATTILNLWSAGCATVRTTLPQHFHVNTKLAPTGSDFIQRIAYQAETPLASLDASQQDASVSQEQDQEMVSIDAPSLSSLGALGDLGKELRPEMGEKSFYGRVV